MSKVNCKVPCWYKTHENPRESSCTVVSGGGQYHCLAKTLSVETLLVIINWELHFDVRNCLLVPPRKRIENIFESEKWDCCLHFADTLGGGGNWPKAHFRPTSHCLSVDQHYLPPSMHFIDTSEPLRWRNISTFWQIPMDSSCICIWKVNPIHTRLLQSLIMNVHKIPADQI